MFAALLLYLFAQLGLCYAVSRFIRSEADYLLAGRSLGTFLATFSIFATWFGAETVMGSSGAIAANGLAGSRADPFGYTLCLLLMGIFVAGAIRARNYVTVSDFYREHYGRRNEVLASVIIIPTSLIWAAAQIQAFALVLSSVSPLPVSQSLIAAVLIVIAYTWLGGLLGDVIADFIQGVVIIIGLAVLLVFLIMKAGGPVQAISMIQPSQLNILAPHETVLSQLNAWAIPILGSMVAPEALSRSLATLDPGVARRSCFWGGVLYLVVGLIPVVIALVGRHLIPLPPEADRFLPVLVQSVMPPWVTVLFLGALISAILSTIDSTLLSIAGLASHNVILPAIKRPVSEPLKILIARVVVLLAGLISYAIATGGNSIYELVETASSFGSAGFLICVLGGLYLPGVSAWGATAVLLGGVGLTLLLDYALAIEGAYLWTLVGCAGIYVGFRIRENKRQPETPEK